MSNDKVPWGEIGYITYKRTYARRLKENDFNSPTEEFEDTVDRIIKGCRKQIKVGFTEKEEKQLKKYFMGLKGSVAGRFWWQLGTKTVDKLGLLSLQNCAFTTVDSPIRPFTWAMDALMLGSGVGYNIQREYVYQIPTLKKKKIKIERVSNNGADFIVPDSREGWVKLLGHVLKSYFYSGKGFTYSTDCVRGKGTLIKGFGGTASGPEDLVDGMNNICKVLDNRRGKKIRPIDCLDIMNIIGGIVVAGNVRRSAQIAIGDMDDLQFLSAKRWDLGNIPNWRAMSNNSVVCNDFNELPEQFWEGYKGNGEPYGLINLKMAREVGRTGDTNRRDPDIAGFNPCFVGSTQLLTSDGFKSIGSLVDKDDLLLINERGETHKGKVWSNGKKPTVIVKNSIGEVEQCTKDHVFKNIKGQSIKAMDLKGQRIMPLIDINNQNDLYTQLGFIQGDGNLTRLNSRSHKGLEVNIGQKDQEIGLLFNVEYSIDKRSYYINGFNKKLKELDFQAKVLPERGLPLSFDNWTDDNQLSFLRGVYSANGSVIKGKRIAFKSTCLDLVNGMSLCLSKYGITSYITTNQAKDITFSNGTCLCKESYDLNISRYDSVRMFAKKIGFVHEYKNKDLADILVNNSPMITSVKQANEEEVFDFNLQDDTHWGVIGNGYIAHNCAEQSLAPYETCCLAEVFLPNIESKEEMIDVCKYLYRINKHSLALKCHHSETEEIVHKNMRMGIGITGYCMATKKQISWLGDVYKELVVFDKKYSKKHGFPESIKITTVKPSGTLSLLAGTTPGGHPGFSTYHIRRMRMSANIPLVEVCRQHGYKVEFRKNFDGTDDHSTVVVEFPCKFPKRTVVAKDITAIDQLEIIRKLQKDWSDNSVSVTIYYKKEELDDIKKWMSKNYNNGLKTVSFLLHSEHGFVQAPLEEITEEQYREMTKNTTPITNVEVKETDISEDQIGCSGGHCPIK